MNIKIGGKVKTVANEDGYKVFGLQGVVVAKYEGMFKEDPYWGVSFSPEMFRDGHDCGGKLTGTHGLWVRQSKLRAFPIQMTNK